MTNVRAIRLVFLLLFAQIVNGGCDAPKSLQRFRYEQPHLGTHVRLVFYAPTEAVANRAATLVYEKVARLDAVFSNYRLDSELMRLCSDSSWGSSEAKPLIVSEELWTVLKTADQVSRRSDGAFDVTIGPLSRLWKRAIKNKQLPDAERIREAKSSRVGYQFIEFHEDRRAVRLLRKDMRIDLGGIAKGYIADQLLEELKRLGIQSALIDIGGDLALGAAPPDKAGWTVAIRSGGSAVQGVTAENSPENETRLQPELGKSLVLSNCGVATSGDSFQQVVVDGKVYSHIVDGRTGMGITNRVTVTTIAKNAMVADAMASALSILAPAERNGLLRHFPATGARAVELGESGPVARVIMYGDTSRFGDAAVENNAADQRPASMDAE